MVPQVAQVLDDRAFRNVEVLAGDRLDDLLMVSHCFATNLRGELEGSAPARSRDAERDRPLMSISCAALYSPDS